MVVQISVAEISVFMSKEVICHQKNHDLRLRLGAYLKVPLDLEEHWVLTVSGDNEAWSDGIWTSGDKAENAWSSSMQKILEGGLHTKIPSPNTICVDHGAKRDFCVRNRHCMLDTATIDSLFFKPWHPYIRSFNKS